MSNLDLCMLIDSLIEQYDSLIENSAFSFEFDVLVEVEMGA